MYGEWLVLYNTVFNFVLLSFTCEVSGLKIRKRRLLISAMLSGLIAVIFRNYVGSSIVSFIFLLVVAFGFRWRELIRRGIVVWIAALFLGGCLLLLQPTLHKLSSSNFLIVSGLLASGTLYMFYRSWHNEKRQRLEETFVLSTALTFEKNEIPLSSYIDTGNVCTEPLSGKPVHFVSYKAVEQYLPKEWCNGLEQWKAEEPYDVSMLPSSLIKRIRFIQLATVQQDGSVALAIRFDQWSLASLTKTLFGEYVVLTRNATKFPENTEAILHVSALLQHS